MRAKKRATCFHVVTIDVVTGVERSSQFASAALVPSFIGIPDIFARPSRVPAPEWPTAPGGFEPLVRGTVGSLTDDVFRHYFIFKKETD